jgi:hypothetical protein
MKKMKCVQSDTFGEIDIMKSYGSLAEVPNSLVEAEETDGTEDNH